MVIGIDATNIHYGGGLTHLVGLLSSAEPVRHQFEKIVIWASQSTLACIMNYTWLVKRTDPVLRRNFMCRSFEVVPKSSTVFLMS